MIAGFDGISLHRVTNAKAATAPKFINLAVVLYETGSYSAA
jgi:hypothetical protein